MTIANAPGRIYLQVGDDAEPTPNYDGCTWCADRINESDVEYVRGDLSEEALHRAALDARDSAGIVGLDAAETIQHLAAKLRQAEQSSIGWEDSNGAIRRSPDDCQGRPVAAWHGSQRFEIASSVSTSQDARP